MKTEVIALRTEEEKEDGNHGEPRSHRSWADLPRDILLQILAKLSPFPYLSRFRCVCRSWLSVAGKERYHARSRIPWLLLPEEYVRDDETDRGIRRFYSPASPHLLQIKLLDLCGRRYVGSAYGWLVLHGDDNFNGDEMRLLNPLTRVEIPLPPQSEDFGYQDYPTFIKKAVLSSSPSDSSSDCVVLIICECRKILAFARPGDAEWTPIRYHGPELQDAIYYRGKFIAVNRDGEIMRCDISKDNGSQPEAVKIAGRPPSLDAEYRVEFYLVESPSGDLLQVLRQRKKYKQILLGTCKFWVFKLVDWKKSVWEPVSCLGDCSLFIGLNTSMAVSTPELDLAGWKRNCIFFTDDDVEILMDIEDHIRDLGLEMGFYNLEDERIYSCYDGHFILFFTAPMWITPSL